MPYPWPRPYTAPSVKFPSPTRSTGHFRDIGHDPDVHDVTYENSQARERTQILMDIANQSGGIVIGTGDMSRTGTRMGHNTTATTCPCTA